VISRVADSCFWLTRHLERLDTLARLLDVNHAFQLDLELPQAERWRPLVVVTGQEADFRTRIGDGRIDDGEAVQRYLTWDRENASSLFASVRGARENARTIRECMSVETWEVVNDLWIWIRSRSAQTLYAKNRSAFYAHLNRQCQLFHGISHSAMLHEEPFVFMKLGRAVERTGQTARILDVKHHSLGDKPSDQETTADAAQWLAILRCCRAFDPFFQRPANTLSGPSVLSFLLFDRAFSHSVLHGLDQTRELLAQMRRTDPPGVRRRSWGLADRFRGELLQMCVQDVQHIGVHPLLTRIVDTTSALCTAIHDDYLDPPEDALRRLARVIEPRQRVAIATGAVAAA
jgi:uncharacterized alpha-E superfamily protein